jgi:hypothetical protein
MPHEQRSSSLQLFQRPVRSETDLHSETRHDLVSVAAVDAWPVVDLRRGISTGASAQWESNLLPLSLNRHVYDSIFVQI